MTTTRDHETHDRVLTIAIGDRLPDGTTLPRDKFRAAADSIAIATTHRGGEVFAITEGRGVGSDGDNLGAVETSALIRAGNVRDVQGLRRDVGSVLQSWGMTSAAFAIDRTHSPVWAS